MQIVNFDEEHLVDLINLYNKVFKDAYYCYPLTEKYLRKRLISSKMYNPDYCLMALDFNLPIAFCLGCSQGTPLAIDVERACIALVIVSPSYQRKKVGTKIVKELLDRFKRANKKNVSVSLGWFGFWPGIDEDWTLAIKFFKSLGFKEEGRAASMRASLKDHNVPKKYRDKELELQKQGIIIKPYNHEYLTRLDKFLKDNFSGGWYYETMAKVKHGVEEFNGFSLIDVYAPEEVLLVLRRKNVIGFSVIHSANTSMGCFGPVGLKKDYRGRGIGTVLLAKSLAILKEKGMSQVDLWTARYGFHPEKYYPKLGFNITKTWITFTKDLYFNMDI